MKKKKPNLKWIYSLPIQNYLWERGIYPVYEDDVGNKAAYVASKELRAALESYYIQFQFYQNGRY